MSRHCFLYAVLFFFTSASAQVSIGNYALTGVTIIDANHKTPVAHQTILIVGNAISGIFPDGTKQIPDSVTVIKVDGKYLLPGLIDAHVHMATDPSGVDNREHTLKVLKKMLLSGITSVRDMAGDARTLAGLSRDAMTGDIICPNIFYSAIMAGPAFFKDPRSIATAQGGTAGKMPYMLGITDSTNLPLAIAAAKGTGATAIKLYAQLSPPLVNRIVAEATRQGMHVWGHAYLDQAKPTDVVKAGVTPISHSPLLLYDKFHKVPASWKRAHANYDFISDSMPDLTSLFELMKAHHTILDATMLAYKQWADDDTAMRYEYEITKLITARAYKAGVMIDAGTDDDQKEFVQKEMELLVKDAGIAPIDAIIAATLHGAMAIGIEDQVGTVAVGKMADLLILDKNPLENISNINVVFLVIKNGKIYKQ